MEELAAEEKKAEIEDPESKRNEVKDEAEKAPTKVEEKSTKRDESQKH